MWAKRKQPGFTIVELLIVVVVIGILAAITIVAYNGIQTRAENTKTINGVAAYVKIFALYASDKGEYPSTTVYPCIGSPPSGQCARVASGTTTCSFSGPTYVYASFDDLLTPYMGSTKPAISDQKMTCIGGEEYRGAYVFPNATDTKNLRFFYHLRGDQPCSGVGGVIYGNRLQSGDVTKCTVNMPAL